MDNSQEDSDNILGEPPQRNPILIRSSNIRETYNPNVNTNPNVNNNPNVNANPNAESE
jgi:hypothetical protein